MSAFRAAALAVFCFIPSVLPAPARAAEDCDRYASYQEEGGGWRAQGGAAQNMAPLYNASPAMRMAPSAEMPGVNDSIAAPLPPAEAYMPAPAPSPLTPHDIDRHQYSPGAVDREQYEHYDTNPVHLAAEDPVSTFSIDVDTASYANARRFIEQGRLPPRDSVRVEEFINAFDYDYPLATDKNQPFRPTVALYPTPWNPGTQLLHIGIRGYDIPDRARPAANLVFLIDVSGSMSGADKLPLVRQSLCLLTRQLDSRDRVAMVVYAGAAGTVLEPTPGNRHDIILAALDKLQAGGSTAGAEGIRQAYALAERNFERGAVNRVILATDGDFNVGINDPEQLKDFISTKRDTGIYLNVLGFGTGNYNDHLMQELAQNGNGIAAYIDSLSEARRVLVEGMQGTLFPIANDVKIQVEFNPARVAEYRLIGYETRALNREDFNNDAVDAGEIGAGHRVTALYEIVPVGSTSRLIDDSRYAPAPKLQIGTEGEYAFLRIRYKLPGQDESRLIERPVTDHDAYPALVALPGELRLAAAVAGFGQLLRGAPYLKDWSYDDVLALARSAEGRDPYGHRAEFLSLVEAAESLPQISELPPGR
jgi:Ca-activated chloride channel family protein